MQIHAASSPASSPPNSGTRRRSVSVSPRSSLMLLPASPKCSGGSASLLTRRPSGGLRRSHSDPCMDVSDNAMQERQQYVALSLLEGVPLSAVTETEMRRRQPNSGARASVDEGDECVTPSSKDKPFLKEATGKEMESGSVLLVVAVVVCACSCQAPYEMLFARDRGCGDLISLSEYVYSLILSAPGALRARWTNGRWQVHWLFHVCLAASSLAYALQVSMAFATAAPIPVLIILKNGNLVANLIVGLLFLRRRYSIQQVLAVFLATIGLVLTTVAGQDASAQSSKIQSDAIVGVLLLVSAVFMRAGGSAVQEVAFKRAGSAPVAEVLLWRSVLGLPFLIMKVGSIRDHAELWNAPVVGGLAWPGMWLLLLTNLVFDYLCKVTITQLICNTSALTATMVLAFQRFASFVLSASFLNPVVPSLSLWVGSIAVLVASVAYATAPQEQPSSGDKNKKVA